MVLPLVEAEDVRVGRKTKGEKYAKYAQAIAKDLRWFKDRVDESPDGKIRMKIGDIKKELGKSFERLSDKAVYYGLKFVLFHEGLVVDAGIHRSGEKLLIIRRGIPGDKLPSSLSEVVEPDDDDMPELGNE